MLNRGVMKCAAFYIAKKYPLKGRAKLAPGKISYMCRSVRAGCKSPAHKACAALTCVCGCHKSVDKCE